MEKTLKLIDKKLTTANGVVFHRYSFLNAGNGKFYGIEGLTKKQMEEFAGQIVVCQLMRKHTIQEKNKETGKTYDREVIQVVDIRPASEEEVKAFNDELMAFNSSTLEDL